MKKNYVVGLLLAVIFLSGCGEKKPQITPTPTPTPEFKILKDGEGPKVELIPNADKLAVMLKISKITPDIKGIDFSLTYDTNGIQRGAIGSLANTGQDTISKKIDLGSCSKNVCVYDKNVTKLLLDIKFTTDDEPLVFQKEYDL